MAAVCLRSTVAQGEALTSRYCLDPHAVGCLVGQHFQSHANNVYILRAKIVIAGEIYVKLLLTPKLLNPKIQQSRVRVRGDEITFHHSPYLLHIRR
jgi:hypothetical protein